MTNELFCEIESEISGEKIDNINQLKNRKFTGLELKEYIEDFIELMQKKQNDRTR